MAGGLLNIPGVPINPLGLMSRQLYATASSLTAVRMDAANEAVMLTGQIFTEDGGSHTIDTSGSSSIGWRSAAVTFANAGTTLKVGVADLDTANGPPSRAVNVADVITFDVAAAFTGGGGGVTANAWQTSVPTTGSKTIAHGDFVCIAWQMTARGGADFVDCGHVNSLSNTLIPCVSTFLGGVYGTTVCIPNIVLRFSDGTYGYMYGAYVMSSQSSYSWNNTSGQKEYGNLFRVPFQSAVNGVMANIALNANADVVLYSDPLGTPVAERSLTLDVNNTSVSGPSPFLFSSPFVIQPNTDYVVALKPSSATNIAISYKVYGNAAHQASESGGGNGYAVSRDAAAFAALNSGLERLVMAPLVSAFNVTGYSPHAGDFF